MSNRIPTDPFCSWAIVTLGSSHGTSALWSRHEPARHRLPVIIRKLEVRLKIPFLNFYEGGDIWCVLDPGGVLEDISVTSQNMGFSIKFSFSRVKEEPFSIFPSFTALFKASGHLAGQKVQEETRFGKIILIRKHLGWSLKISGDISATQPSQTLSFVGWHPDVCWYCTAPVPSLLCAPAIHYNGTAPLFTSNLIYNPWKSRERPAFDFSDFRINS